MGSGFSGDTGNFQDIEFGSAVDLDTAGNIGDKVATVLGNSLAGLDIDSNVSSAEIYATITVKATTATITEAIGTEIKDAVEDKLGAIPNITIASFELGVIPLSSTTTTKLYLSITSPATFK